MRKVSMLVAVSLLCLTAIVGCGGGGGGGNDGFTDGYISSTDFYFGTGEYADLVTATATRRGYVVIEMIRAGEDPVDDPKIRVVRDHCTTSTQWNASVAYGYLAVDDDSGEGLNARAHFYATSGQRFTIAFTTCSSGDTGGYRWRVYETNSPPAAEAIGNTRTDKAPAPQAEDGDLLQSAD